MQKQVVMNMKILEVIYAVLDYKRFIISNSHIYKDNNFDWYEQTKGYYNSLPLPEGMDKSINDFERVLTFGLSSNQDQLNKMNETQENELYQFTWK